MRTARLLGWDKEKELDGAFEGTLKVRLELAQDRGGRPLEGEISIPARYDINAVVGVDRESGKNLSDPIGRQFPVFISEQHCSTSFVVESYLHSGSVNPERKTKNAWAMRDEILNIADGSEGEQIQSLFSLLNKWGLWWMWSHNTKDPLVIRQMNPFWGMSFAFPHLILRDCEKYRQALLPQNAKKWLSKAEPLNVVQTNKSPYFLVERYDCARAIEATITIDHLSGRRFGFCQRCGKQFEQETQRKKNYCSRTCINAANVQNWRNNQPEVPK